MNYTIPLWIACQSYLIDTDESRTIIFNNKTHQTILLEGLASDLYSYMVTSGTKLKEYSQKKNIDDELEVFLKELKNNKLLVLDTDVDDCKNMPMHYKAVDNQDNIENKMSDWAFKHGFLYSVFMEMTYKCNLKCIHCYNSKSDFTSQIKYVDAKRLIDDMVRIGCFNLTLSGGECTLNNDFLEIVRYARSKKLNISIYTNGQSLYDNPKLFDDIVSMYPYRVGISIYSADAIIHDKVTGIKGSWNKSISVIEKLKRSGINTEIKSVQLKESVVSWKETLKLARTFDASSTFDVTLTPTIDGDKKTWKHSVDDDMLMNLYTEVESPIYMGGLKIPKPYNIEIDGPCFAGIKILTITPTLDVTGCCSLPLKFGNLKEDSLKDIWSKAVNDKKGKLYEWQNIKLKEFKDCFKYEYCEFCHFCAGMGMLEDKLFNKSQELCRIAKLKMKAFNQLNKRG